VPKFELYNHDEHFNIYYGIFLWTLNFCHFWPNTILKGDHLRIISAKFGWDWHSSFRGEDFFLILSPLFSNLHKAKKINMIKGFLWTLNFCLFWPIRPKKKICVFTVTRPTLIFASDPMHFHTEFG
jgi:hypothetical protein